MGVGVSAFGEAIHGSVVDQEHDEVEEGDVVSVGVEPEGQHSFVCHRPFHHHRRQLGHCRRPDQVFAVGLGEHEPEEGE